MGLIITKKETRMGLITTKIAAFTAATMDKKALSAEYVAQMMYKSPTHKKEIYDIATKALKGGKGAVLPKHPLVEKKLTTAFTEAMNPLDGMVSPVVKKAGIKSFDSLIRKVIGTKPNINTIPQKTFPIIKKAADSAVGEITDKYKEYRRPGYLEDMSDAEIDAYVDNYYKTTTHRIPLAYKAINELMAKYDNNGKDGNARRFKGMKR